VNQFLEVTGVVSEP